jgi:caffeoyl-CoA O-methyltransferase
VPRRKGQLIMMSLVAGTLAAAALITAMAPSPPRQAAGASELDRRVRSFLDRHKNDWHDMNVPEVDGRTLHELILKHRYQRAVEIGTSTGHSGIWIAWALSKTGGKLVTIDIDERRHGIAVANFREAGLADYVDARLGDAHEIVPRLEGPIDFVFSDADKEWYTKYLEALWPKLQPGGCFTAHNVSSPGMSGIREFLARVRALPDGETTINTSSSAGISITYKKAR